MPELPDPGPHDENSDVVFDPVRLAWLIIAIAGLVLIVVAAFVLIPSNLGEW